MWVKAYRVLRIKLGNVTGEWDSRGGSGSNLVSSILTRLVKRAIDH